METVVFIVLAALVIPMFYLATQPVIKDMMTPTSYIKARFVAERKMEELLAYTYSDAALAVTSPAYTSPCYTDYSGYDCQLAITYLNCNSPSGCVGYATDPPVLITTSTPTNYKQIAVTVRTPEGKTYQAVNAVTARY